ncbi:MAG TPA: metallopeptidase family protein [Actinomycetota bacterium]|jgi:predicted Zn-dependent protease with MMP-like domain|nr:metallopeptidase family protein [Actinomycetota bacterium]
MEPGRMTTGSAPVPERDRFVALVAQALDALPEWVHRALDNVEVLVDDHPPDGADLDMLGLYEGIPLTERGSDYTGVLPDRITLYAGPIRREAGPDEAALTRVIGETVVHEVAHHFGIDDERLHEIDRY